jgi:hypothetical protein
MRQEPESRVGGFDEALESVPNSLIKDRGVHGEPGLGGMYGIKKDSRSFTYITGYR